jgi:hypothetical protein
LSSPTTFVVHANVKKHFETAPTKVIVTFDAARHGKLGPDSSLPAIEGRGGVVGSRCHRLKILKMKEASFLARLGKLKLVRQPASILQLQDLHFNSFIYFTRRREQSAIF